MSNNDGRVVINIDSNASKVAREFENLDNVTAKYEKILKGVEGTSNASLPVYEKLRAKLKEQQQAANNALTSFQKLANVQKSGIGFSQLNSVTGSAIERLKNLALQGRQNSAEFQKLASVVKNANRQMANANSVVNKATGFNQLGSSILSLNNILGAFSVGYIVNQLIDLGKNAINASMDFQALENRMNAAAGNKSIGADSLAYIREQADRLGLEFRTTADSFAGFEAAALRSGLTLEQTKQIFTDVSTAATSMQLSTEKVQLVFKALEQISGKGTVSMEELRQQLGDSLPGAFEIAAQSMGMTTRAFYDAVASGEVLSSDFLPKFAKAIREQLGGSAEEASTQLRADFNRLNTAMFDLSNTAGQVLSPATQKIVKDLTQAAIATQTFINQFSAISVKVSAVYSDETNKVTAQLQEYSKLLNSKKLTAAETDKLKTIITELSSKYPAYIGQITQELKINGQLSDTTAGLVRAEMERSSAISLMTEELNKAIQKEELLYKTRQKTAILMTGPFFQHRERQVNIQRYEAEANAYDESTKALRNLIESRQDVENRLKNLNSNNSNYSLAPSIGGLGSSGDDKKGREKHQLTIFEKLQKSYNDEYRRLQDLATQGITSGKVWDSQVAKVNNLSAALERVKQATDLSVVPPFQALNTEIQKAQERVNNLAASKIVNLQELKEAKKELTDLRDRAQQVQDLAATSPYQQKQNAISRLQAQYLDLFIQGQGNSAAAINIKNTWKQYTNEINRANTALQNSVGLTWNNISSTISTQLSSALTTPLQAGENAFERLGNVALNIIGQIAQAWLSSSLMNFFNGSSGGKGLGTRFGNAAKGAAAGSAGGIWGAVGGAISGFFNANGNAFSHGRVLPFAQGGVVSSPTMFPMAGNRTGIMGEKGAEAIMPLKRAPNGQLGVQAQTAPATVNIYNQSDSRIETVQRPDGETDIFIRRVNNALRNERTQAGFSSALQRNQSRGVQAS